MSTYPSAINLSSGETGDSLELSSGQILNNFHKSVLCEGGPCPVHNPSSHTLEGCPLAFTGAFMVRLVDELAPDAELVELPGLGKRYVVIDPDDYIFRTTGQAIVRNSGTCNACGDSITSTHIYDFVTCKCGATFVDGGHSYLRRSDGLTDTSAFFSSHRV